jgi:DtxR family transcriptional regulator, Mn-dependent transcriptional regulator
MSVSQVMHRYAAEIYRLEQDYEQVALSLLSEHIDVSVQAITLMIQRMKKQGYVTYEPYRGVNLTPEGRRIAMPALRRHRLVEVFLVRVMAYDWATAHELSDVFERGVNEDIENRMDEITGHPNRCPHGEPIPAKDGVMPVLTDKPLINVPSGSDCTVSRVRTHDPDKLRYIAYLGLIPGIPFHLLSCAPFKGPLRLQMKSQDHVIGYETASLFWVDIQKEGHGNHPVRSSPVGQR